MSNDLDPTCDFPDCDRIDCHQFSTPHTLMWLCDKHADWARFFMDLAGIQKAEPKS